jgi:streptomycin 6-kinase
LPAPRPVARLGAVEVPQTVRNKALGYGAAQWLADLPDLVATLAEQWRITVGGAYGDSTEAYVARARLDDGTPAVLKLLVPRPGGHAANEITVLRLAGGEGCVRLLRADPARDALLLERLGPSMYELRLPIAARLETLCDLAGRLWRPAPGRGLPTGAAKGRWLIEAITTGWAELGGPCAERTVEHAVACAQRRVAGHDDERAVLVHGDVHQWNALRSGDGFRLVDPDGLLADPEYDLAILMREDPVELMAGDPRDRSRLLAARTGLEEVRIWEWGVVERVSTGLLATAIDLQPLGREMLVAADVISRSN